MARTDDASMQPIATHNISTRFPAQRRATHATLATSKCIAKRSFAALQQRKAVAA
jgi:hypothetical protein